MLPSSDLVILCRCQSSTLVTYIYVRIATNMSASVYSRHWGLEMCGNYHRSTTREHCCCVYYTNVRYKLLTLSKEIVDKRKKKTNEAILMDIIICETGNGAVYHAPDCINDVCTKCQDTSTTLKKYYESIPDSQTFTWCRWENKETGATWMRKVLKTKSGTKDDLIQEFPVASTGNNFP